MGSQAKESYGNLFKLLSACFCLPNKAIFEEEKVFDSMILLCNEVCSDATVDVQKMSEDFAKSSEEELKVEYARLFVGPHSLIAPPFGSVYLESKGLLMGNSTIAVSEIYEECGIDLAADVKQLPDHITLELEFVYFLIFQQMKEPHNAKSWIASQESFVKTYLASWTPQFVENIRKGSNSIFYQHLGGLLEKTVNSFNSTFDQD
ncbi:MAG: molecular chaperone TorD family protein [Bacteriovoracaceae bacterium]|nr:molecular chaperone TorD family protein [Bacteriovoracaceae bacterium]